MIAPRHLMSAGARPRRSQRRRRGDAPAPARPARRDPSSPSARSSPFSASRSRASRAISSCSSRPGSSSGAAKAPGPSSGLAPAGARARIAAQRRLPGSTRRSACSRGDRDAPRRGAPGARRKRRPLFRRACDATGTTSARCMFPKRRVEAAMRDAVGEKPIRCAARSRHRHRPHARTVRAAQPSAPSASISPPPCSPSRAAGSRRPALRNVQLRQGDIYALPIERNSVDLVIVHQVLHYLDDPAAPLREAARALAPGGRLLVVDFAPHQEEALRDEHAHRRLGFAHDEIAGLLDAGRSRDRAASRSRAGRQGRRQAHRFPVARPRPARHR